MMSGKRNYIFTLAIMIYAAWPTAVHAERVALVIGNAAYESATSLANPVNDATDMARSLEATGFKVILGLDLNRRAFASKIREFSNALAKADDAILYYAGHGLQVGGQNYLIPVDARLDTERDLDFSAIRLSFIVRQMELQREDKTNIIFLDACRDNPLARNLARSMGTRSVAVGVGLAQVKTGVGTFIAFSTQPGNVAVDGTGRNSPFTGALVNRMRAPGRSLNALMIEVRKDVLAATKGKQVPWDHSALTGDFFFSGGEGSPAKKSRTNSVSAETIVRITQLRVSIDRLREDEKEDQRSIFDLYRDKARETDASARTNLQRKVTRLNFRKARKIQRRLRLQEELRKLEEKANVAR